MYQSSPLHVFYFCFAVLKRKRTTCYTYICWENGKNTYSHDCSSLEGIINYIDFKNKIHYQFIYIKITSRWNFTSYEDVFSAVHRFVSNASGEKIKMIQKFPFFNQFRYLLFLFCLRGTNIYNQFLTQSIAVSSILAAINLYHTTAEKTFVQCIIAAPLIASSIYGIWITVIFILKTNYKTHNSICLMACCWHFH